MKIVNRKIDGKIQKFNEIRIDKHSVLLLPVGQEDKEVKEPKILKKPAQKIVSELLIKNSYQSKGGTGKKQIAFTKFYMVINSAFMRGIITEFKFLTLLQRGV